MKKAVSTPGAPQPAGPYSQAIKAGGWVYVAGQRPVDPQTGALVQGSVEAQARRVLQNIEAVLEAAGSSLHNVVKTTVYLQSLEDFAAVNRVYAEYFPAPLPARTTVGATLRGVAVEIDAVATC